MLIHHCNSNIVCFILLLTDDLSATIIQEDIISAKMNLERQIMASWYYWKNVWVFCVCPGNTHSSYLTTGCLWQEPLPPTPQKTPNTYDQFWSSNCYISLRPLDHILGIWKPAHLLIAFFNGFGGFWNSSFRQNMLTG